MWPENIGYSDQRRDAFIRQLYFRFIAIARRVAGTTRKNIGLCPDDLAQGAAIAAVEHLSKRLSLRTTFSEPELLAFEDESVRVGVRALQNDFRDACKGADVRERRVPDLEALVIRAAMSPDEALDAAGDLEMVSEYSQSSTRYASIAKVAFDLIGETRTQDIAEKAKVTPSAVSEWREMLRRKMNRPKKSDDE